MISLSTTKVQYMAATLVLRWQYDYKDCVSIGFDCRTINIGCGSQSAIHLAKNPMYRAWTKYVDVQYLFVIETIANEKIKLKKIDTQVNVID